MKAVALYSALATISGTIVEGFHYPASSIASSSAHVIPASSIGLQATADDGASSASNPQLSRRQIGELSIAAIGLGTSFLGTRENTPQDYGLWGLLPVGPYKRKKTIKLQYYML